MLTSDIISAKTSGSQHFGESFPDIFQIQNLIENAWDNGINAQGRAETGGIKGTRKYIGTPEVVDPAYMPLSANGLQNTGTGCVPEPKHTVC